MWITEEEKKVFFVCSSVIMRHPLVTITTDNHLYNSLPYHITFTLWTHIFHSLRLWWGPEKGKKNLTEQNINAIRLKLQTTNEPHLIQMVTQIKLPKNFYRIVTETFPIIKFFSDGSVYACACTAGCKPVTIWSLIDALLSGNVSKNYCQIRCVRPFYCSFFRLYLIKSASVTAVTAVWKCDKIRRIFFKMAMNIARKIMSSENIHQIEYPRTCTDHFCILLLFVFFEFSVVFGTLCGFAGWDKRISAFRCFLFMIFDQKPDSFVSTKIEWC